MTGNKSEGGTTAFPSPRYTSGFIPNPAPNPFPSPPRGLRSCFPALYNWLATQLAMQADPHKSPTPCRSGGREVFEFRLWDCHCRSPQISQQFKNLPEARLSAWVSQESSKDTPTQVRIILNFHVINAGICFVSLSLFCWSPAPTSCFQLLTGRIYQEKGKGEGEKRRKRKKKHLGRAYRN